MLQYLEERFAGQRAKLRVVSAMLRIGVRVDGEGRLYCDSIELAPAKMGRAMGVDRRVVIETAREIADDPKLFAVFSSLFPISNVSRAAKHFGHDVIEIDADPNTVGLTAKVASVLARHKVGIRQIITDDPDLYPEPKMMVVVEGRLPRKAVEELRSLDVQAISFR
ncbi:MAG: regulator [Candidatus Micrarchaeota archaeon]|nr:regulator [Candidatus Micrarchaeota archaeon]